MPSVLLVHSALVVSPSQAGLLSLGCCLYCLSEDWEIVLCPPSSPEGRTKPPTCMQQNFATSVPLWTLWTRPILLHLMMCCSAVWVYQQDWVCCIRTSYSKGSHTKPDPQPQPSSAPLLCMQALQSYLKKKNLRDQQGIRGMRSKD